MVNPAEDFSVKKSLVNAVKKFVKNFRKKIRKFLVKLLYVLCPYVDIMQYTIKIKESAKSIFKDFQLEGESANDTVVRLLDNVEGRMPAGEYERISNIAVHPDTLERVKSLRLHKGEPLQDVLLRAISLYSDE